MSQASEVLKNARDTWNRGIASLGATVREVSSKHTAIMLGLKVKDILRKPKSDVDILHVSATSTASEDIMSSESRVWYNFLGCLHRAVSDTMRNPLSSTRDVDMARHVSYMLSLQSVFVYPGAFQREPSKLPPLPKVSLEEDRSAYTVYNTMPILEQPQFIFAYPEIIEWVHAVHPHLLKEFLELDGVSTVTETKSTNAHLSLEGSNKAPTCGNGSVVTSPVSPHFSSISKWTDDFTATLCIIREGLAKRSTTLEADLRGLKKYLNTLKTEFVKMEKIIRENKAPRARQRLVKGTWMVHKDSDPLSSKETVESKFGGIDRNIDDVLHFATMMRDLEESMCGWSFSDEPKPKLQEESKFVSDAAPSVETKIRLDDFQAIVESAASEMGLPNLRGHPPISLAATKTRDTFIASDSSSPPEKVRCFSADTRKQKVPLVERYAEEVVRELKLDINKLKAMDYFLTVRHDLKVTGLPAFKDCEFGTFNDIKNSQTFIKEEGKRALMHKGGETAWVPMQRMTVFSASSASPSERKWPELFTGDCQPTIKKKKLDDMRSKDHHERCRYKNSEDIAELNHHLGTDVSRLTGIRFAKWLKARSDDTNNDYDGVSAGLLYKLCCKQENCTWNKKDLTNFSKVAVKLFCSMKSNQGIHLFHIRTPTGIVRRLVQIFGIATSEVYCC